MPFDAICLQAVIEELKPQLLGLRIDKVQQPTRDQVILLLRGNRRLLLSAGASAPRIQLTETPRENPAEPPMFCMLLRKHLVGAKIADIVQPTLERIVKLELDITDDFGQPGKRTLVLETMGRRSNLILLDEEERIIECMRRVDADMSASRQVLPGLYYEQPAATDRLPITEETQDGFLERISMSNPEQTIDAFLLDQYFGISPLMAREVAFRVAGETDARIFMLPENGKELLWDKLSWFIRSVQENNFTPVCLYRDEKPFDFSCLPVHQYGIGAREEVYESFSA
jgi:predicted ribosome quality control (RQC) complex YloA/Tae2 family protein